MSYVKQTNQKLRFFNQISTLIYCKIFFMKKKSSKKYPKKKIKKNINELGQTKNSAKFILFLFGIGPIIGFIVFLFSKGFFNNPNI